MKNSTRRIAAIASTLALQAHASPEMLSTPEADIFVNRPTEHFIADKSAAATTLQEIANRNFGFLSVKSRQGKLIPGTPGMLGSISENPVTQGVNNELLKQGMSLKMSKNAFNMSEPKAVDPAKLEELFKVQTGLYKVGVERMGDPDKLSEKASNQKFLANAAALVTAGVAMGKIGTTAGSQLTLGSGMGDWIVDGVRQFSGVLSPADWSSITANSSQYKAVDGYVVKGFAGEPGQAIIAYKTERSEATEQAALIQAITFLLAPHKSAEEIQKARDADFAARKAIWASCKSEGRCQD